MHTRVCSNIVDCILFFYLCIGTGVDDLDVDFAPRVL